MLSYNRVIWEKYVTHDNYTAANNESEGQIESPKMFVSYTVRIYIAISILVVDAFVFSVNVLSTVDEFTFNEQDELEHTTSWNSPRSDTVLEPMSSLEYLKHQKQAFIAYADINNVAVEDETHL